MLCIVQNETDVPPGSIATHLQSLGVPYQIVKPYAGEPLPKIADIAAVIVLGGTMGANDDDRYPFLADLIRWTRTLVPAGVPYLGICLGGQLLAAALGGTVHANRWGELGFSSVELNDAAQSAPLFSGMGPYVTSFQWHNDSFDLPPGAVLLAGTAACPHQAFRIGSNAWGVQFHPEVTLDIILHWSVAEKKSSSFIFDTAAAWSSSEQTILSSSRQILHNFLSSVTQ